MQLTKLILGALMIFAAAGSIIAAPTIITLDNGMEVMLVENHGNPVIASVVVVRTGLRNEAVELNGATHFLEHLLFNGTETRTQKQLYDDMDFLGGYNNANTAQDRTTFMILLERSNFEKGLEIQADMLFHSILPPDKFEKEKGIVTEEIGKDEDSESYRVSRFFDQALFAGTPYQWPILGSRHSIRRLTRDQVWQYYKKHYAPNNMAALLMGDFDTAEMMKTVERIFGQEPPGTLPQHERLELSSLAAANEAQGQILVNQGEAGSHYIRVNLPGPTRSSPDYFPFVIMTQFLSTQLQEELQKSPDLGVTGVSASHFVDRDFGVLQMDVTLDAKANYEPVLKAFHDIALAFADRKFTPEEVAATVTSTRAEEVFNSERPHYYGMMKAEDLAQGGAYFVLNYADALAAVTAEDVARIAKKYLGPSYPLVTVYQALSKEEAARAAESGAKSVSKVFPNGLSAIVEQNQDSKVFAAHFLFKNRSADELALGGKPGMVDFIHHLFDYGPEGFGKEEFQQELKRLGAQPKFYDMAFIPYDDYYTTPEFSYVRMEALDENYRAVLDLLSCTLADPTFRPEAIEAIRGPLMGGARRSQGSVPEKGRTLLKKLLYGNSALAAAVSPSAQDLATFTADDLRKFHRLYFAPGNLVLTVMTSNDADSVMAQVEKTIGSWPAGETLAAVPDIRPNLPASRQEEAGGKDQSFIGIGYTFDVKDPADRAPLAILNAIISDRMQFQLREKEGLAYTLGSSVNFQSNWGVWMATMGTGPQNLVRAEAGIKEQIAKASKEKFAPRDVEKARNAYLGRQMLRSLSRINQTYLMGLAEFRGEGAQSYRKWVQDVGTVNAEEVTRVAREYLRTDGLTVAVVK